MTTREEITAALAALGASPQEFPELAEPDAAAARRQTAAAFVDVPEATWWWEHFKLPTESTRFHNHRAFERICEVVPDPHEPVWFIVEDSRLPASPVFEAAPDLIARVIGECCGFEYYLVARDCSWLLCENHHDTLIAVGDAVRPRLARIKWNLQTQLHDEDR